MNKTLLSVILVIAMAGLSARSVVADEPAAARELLQNTLDQVIALLRDGELEEEIRREKIMAAVDAAFDFGLMAKLSLGPTHWRRLNAAQQAEYSELFVAQLRDSYYDKANLLLDPEQRIEFDAPEPKGRAKVQVVTHVVSKGEPMDIIYQMYSRGDGWQVYDVEVDGVSLVRSFRSQYEQVLRDGTPEDLLARMREKGLKAPGAE